MKLSTGLVFALVALAFFSSCKEVPSSPEVHPLAGAWLATDGTIFDFREDGTFHGIDCAGEEIWGNWVTLSPDRIGFQSLLHDSFYRPQYAIVRKDDRDFMDYIVTGGNHFIAAERIDPEKARAAIELIIEPEIHRPKVKP